MKDVYIDQHACTHLSTTKRTLQHLHNHGHQRLVVQRARVEHALVLPQALRGQQRGRGGGDGVAVARAAAAGPLLDACARGGSFWLGTVDLSP